MNWRAIERDTVPPVADAYSYFSFAQEIACSLRSGQLEQLKAILYDAHARPPLVQFFVGFMLWLSDTSTIQMARHSMMLFLWVLLLSTYFIGARLKDQGVGFLAVLFLACFPQIIGFSRLYWLDFPLTAITALSLMLLIFTEGFRHRVWSMVFGFSLGLGLLTKLSYPCFIVGPLGYVLIHSWRTALRPPFRGQDHRALHRVLINIGLSLGTAAVCAGPWYLPQLGSIWNNFLYNQSSPLMQGHFWLSVENLTLYARYLYESQLGSLFIGWVLLALPFFFRFTRAPAKWFLLLWLIIPYSFHTIIILGVNWSRFTMPYLPAVALVLALGLSSVRVAPWGRLISGVASITALAGYFHLFYSPIPLKPGEFLWDRVLGAGMVAPQSLSFSLPLAHLFSTRDVARTGEASRSSTKTLPRQGKHVERNAGGDERVLPAPALSDGDSDRSGAGQAPQILVAVIPDYSCLTSVFEYQALIQKAAVRFMVPDDPLSFSFDQRFPFPQRLKDPAYLYTFHYIVRVMAPSKVPPPLEHVVGSRQRFLHLLAEHQRAFRIVKEQRLPNGFRLLIYQQTRSPWPINDML